MRFGEMDGTVVRELDVGFGHRSSLRAWMDGRLDARTSRRSRIRPKATNPIGGYQLSSSGSRTLLKSRVTTSELPRNGAVNATYALRTCSVATSVHN